MIDKKKIGKRGKAKEVKRGRVTSRSVEERERERENKKVSKKVFYMSRCT